MTYLVFDNFHDNFKPHQKQILDSLRGKGIDIKEYYSPAGSSLFLAWLGGALGIVRRSAHGDTLIFWYDFQAVICYWLCRLFFLKRRFVVLNILLKEKNTWKNRIVAWLYKPMLCTEDIQITVTSSAYGEALNRRFALRRKYVLLHDVYGYKDVEETSYRHGGRTVFCGGNNGRDWKMAFRVASLMPDVSFTFVMPSHEGRRYAENLPENVNLRIDVSFMEFNELMQASSVVMLPLDTDAPAGLVVVYKAASLGKPVVISDTPVTREYIDEKSGVLCANEAGVYAEAVEKLFSSPSMAATKGENLKRHLHSQCSVDSFVNTLYQMICSSAS